MERQDASRREEDSPRQTADDKANEGQEEKRQERATGERVSSQRSLHSCLSEKKEPQEAEARKKRRKVLCGCEEENKRKKKKKKKTGIYPSFIYLTIQSAFPQKGATIRKPS